MLVSHADTGFVNSIAGVDTSTATLGFLLWELSRRADVVQRLRKELDEVVPDRRTIPDCAVLAKLPYLSAFLNEGMCVACLSCPCRLQWRHPLLAAID